MKDRFELKLLMMQQGIRTQRELARKLGVTESAICQIFRGKLDPSPELVRKMSKVMKVSQTRLKVYL